MTRVRRLWLLLTFLGGLALAAAEDAGITDTVSDLQAEMEQQTARWTGQVKDIAAWLLFALATLSFTWSAAQLVLKNADFQEIVVELVRYILYVGFFLALILNADVWSEALINGFLWVGNHVTSGGAIGLGESFISDWALAGDRDKGELDVVLAMIGVLIILMLLVKMIPDIVQGIINGSTIGSGPQISAMGVMAGAAGGAAAIGSTAGSGFMAVKEASKLSSSQLGSLGPYTPPGSKMAQTLTNLGQAAGQTLGGRMLGDPGAKGSFAGGMARNLRAKNLGADLDSGTGRHGQDHDRPEAGACVRSQRRPVEAHFRAKTGGMQWPTLGTPNQRCSSAVTRLSAPLNLAIDRERV